MKRLLITALLSCAFFVTNAQHINGITIGDNIDKYYKRIKKVNDKEYTTCGMLLSCRGTIRILLNEKNEIRYLTFKYDRGLSFNEAKNANALLRLEYGLSGEEPRTLLKDRRWLYRKFTLGLQTDFEIFKREDGKYDIDLRLSKI
ncbi:hypothetical protein FUAX_44260 (plasmid) [Fulvitalea axinellae]|uniref:Uncharacterized protein n=1 Tax=Fulvitalea axinellae TaxID=1182444 RepID=A0AAU9CZQ6_9BACT|nr:hypothetical protein FUAX_44260 [Fulvitalea axinellae]